MTQHYTRLTESDRKWCNRCKGFTDHKVSNGQLGHCIPCAEKQEADHQRRLAEPPQPKQQGLFA